MKEEWICGTIVGVSTNLSSWPGRKTFIPPCLVNLRKDPSRWTNGHRWEINFLVGIMLKRLTRLILSGGQNVDPRLYGEEKKNYQAMITISNRINLSLPYQRKQYIQKQTGYERNFAVGSDLINVALEEHSTQRSKGIGRDFRLGLPFYPDEKKAVW